MISRSHGLLELIDKRFDSLIHGTADAYCGASYESIQKTYRNSRNFDVANVSAEFSYPKIQFKMSNDYSRFIVVIDHNPNASLPAYSTFSFFKCVGDSRELGMIWRDGLNNNDVNVYKRGDMFSILLDLRGGGRAQILIEGKLNTDDSEL